MELGIHKLQEEISKFGGYRFPEEIRTIINEHFSPAKKNKEIIILPIKSKSSPFVTAFSAIVTNPKTIKLCLSVVNCGCEAINVGCFDSEAFISILQSISFFSQQVEEVDNALKFLRFYSSLLPNFFTRIRVLQVLFSSSLSLIVHPAEIVSSTAFASSQQMISHFFNFMSTETPHLSQTELKEINSIITLKFSKPLFTIGYLILYDLSAQIFDKPIIWLKLPKLPIPTLFELWNLIISSQHTIIESEPQMLDIIESLAIMPIVHPSELMFVVSLNQYCLKSIPSTAISLFSYFLQCLQSTNQSYFALLYFRSLFFSSSSFILLFCQHCDKKGSLFDALLEALDKICDIYLTSNSNNIPVHLSMSPLKIPQNVNIDQNDKHLYQSIPFEICLSIISSLVNHSFSPKADKYKSTDNLLISGLKPDKSSSHSPNSSSSMLLLSLSSSTSTNQVKLSSSSLDSQDNLSDKKVKLKLNVNNKISNKEPLTPQKPIGKNSKIGRHFSTLEDDPIYSDEEEFSSMVNLIWPRLLTLLIKATRYADEESCPFVFKGYHQMLNIFIKYSIQDGRAIVLRILCGLAAKQRIAKEDPIQIEVLSGNLLHKNKKGLFFKKKHEMAYNLLISLLNGNPRLFSRLFLRLFMTFSAVPGNSIDPSFSLKLENYEVVKLCSAVIRGNSFCISFVTSVLIVNAFRFEPIFQAILPSLLKQLENVETRDASYSLIAECLANCFSESTETILLSLVSDLLSNEIYMNITSKYRMMLLNELRTLVTNSLIVNGWNYILSSIHNYDDETIDVSSTILSAICNNHFTRFNQEGQVEEIIKIIFEYASQKAQINVALSSLGLLWVVIPFINTNAEYWKLILSETIILFSDPRNDVAVCAVQTFFSLLSTNVSQLPKEIYSHLIKNCFINQLMAMGGFPESMWSVQQLILQEICHCAISFWQSFEKVPQFTANFWELIIGKHESFMAMCHDQEIKNNAFLFYHESFAIPYFDQQKREFLTNSFNSVVLNLLKNESQKSLVIVNLGRHVARILLSQKPYLQEKTLKIWIEIISNMVKMLLSQTMTNISIDYALEALPKLFPFDEDQNKEKETKKESKSEVKSESKSEVKSEVKNSKAKKDSKNKQKIEDAEVINNNSKPSRGRVLGAIICRGLVRMFIENEIECVRESIYNNFIKIINFAEIDKIHLFIDCKPFFFMPEAEKLLSQVMTSLDTIDKDDRNCIELFQCLTQLANEDPKGDNKYGKPSRALAVLAVEKQINFVKNKVKNLEVNLKLWSLFCDPSSNEFSQEVFDVCFDDILDNIRQSIQLNLKNEKLLLVILKFIEKVKCPPQKFNENENCMTWHINKLANEILPLTNDQRAKISKQAHRVLKVANIDPSDSK